MGYVMKKASFIVLSIALVFLLALCTFAEEDPLPGKDITESVSLNFTVGNGRSARLLDRNVESACSADDLFELQISSTEPIYGIYLLWNDEVPRWTISGETETIHGGNNGFWHEYMPLSGGLNYTMTWTDTPGAELAEVYFLSRGEVPDFVQIWDAPCEKADFLLIPTHADDEHLWFGGTMPYYAGELGYKIQVVYLMKHVSGRHHELLNGLWHVGVRNYPVISEFIDKYSWSLSHAKTLYPEEEVLSFLVENIRRFQPEVIVGHDLKGEYGHGAHILNATVLSERALTAAADPMQCPESYAKYGTWETKKCYLHLYHENEIFIDWTAKILSAFDGKNAYDVAQEGFDQHVSQRDFFSMSLDNREKYGNALFGLIYSTVGPDLARNDFLENIPAQSLTTWVEPEPEPEPNVTETEDISTETTTDSVTNSTVSTTSITQNNNDADIFVFLLIVAAAVFFCVSILIVVFLRRK